MNKNNVPEYLKKIFNVKPGETILGDMYSGTHRYFNDALTPYNNGAPGKETVEYRMGEIIFGKTLDSSNRVVSGWFYKEVEGKSPICCDVFNLPFANGKIIEQGLNAFRQEYNKLSSLSVVFAKRKGERKYRIAMIDIMKVIRVDKPIIKDRFSKLIV